MRRRQSLRKVSPKTLALRSTRQEVVRAVHLRDGTCQFWHHCPRGLEGVPWICAGPLDVHEIIPRSAWAMGQYRIDNTVLICRIHHMWIDNHPLLAHEVGLHGFSYDRPDL